MKRIALVAHDNRKQDLLEWVEHNKENLKKYKIVCTGTTGKLVDDVLNNNGETIFRVKKLKSGPLGGDQQLGAQIADGKIDILIFFIDPMTSQPHDVDVKALLRLAVLYNTPSAFNRSTADFIITSNLFEENYEPIMKDYSKYLNRNV